MSTKSGKVTAKLTWANGFGAQQTQQFRAAQCFIDSEVLRLCGPYTPFQTGMLQASGTLGTVIGSGEVAWVAPYAAAQYYTTSASRSYDARRGNQWFERMKADHGQAIIRGAKRIAGGK